MFRKRRKERQSGSTVRPIGNAPLVIEDHWPKSTYVAAVRAHKIWIVEHDIRTIVGYASWPQWKYLCKNPDDLALAPGPIYDHHRVGDVNPRTIRGTQAAIPIKGMPVKGSKDGPPYDWDVEEEDDDGGE